MKKKFINGRVLLAWLFKSSEIKKDIYSQIEETIAERKRTFLEIIWKSIL